MVILFITIMLDLILNIAVGVVFLLGTFDGEKKAFLHLWWFRIRGANIGQLLLRYVIFLPLTLMVLVVKILSIKIKEVDK